MSGVGQWVVIAMVLALGFACGDDDDAPDAALIALFDAAPSDAPVPDAFVCTLTMCGVDCVDPTTDEAHCGGCDQACTPAGECTASNCECPTNFLPDPFVFTMSGVNAMSSPSIRAFGAFPGTDGQNHSLLIRFQLGVALDTPLDLSQPDMPRVSFRYVSDAKGGPRSRYLTVAGTLTLTRACETGVAGQVTGLSLVEGSGGMMPTPIEGGCTLAGVTISFDIGDDCAGGADAGPIDGG